MSKITRQEVLAKKRDRYVRAGKEHKSKIIDELVELFGYHRKAAIRALRPRVGQRAVSRCAESTAQLLPANNEAGAEETRGSGGAGKWTDR